MRAAFKTRSRALLRRCFNSEVAKATSALILRQFGSPVPGQGSALNRQCPCTHYNRRVSASGLCRNIKPLRARQRASHKSNTGASAPGPTHSSPRLPVDARAIYNTVCRRQWPEGRSGL